MNEIIFNTITEWQDEKFTDATTKHYYKKLLEEINELGKTRKNTPEAKEKLADIAIVFMGLIKKSGFTYRDITEAIANKFAIIRNQEFVFDEVRGVHRRVK